MNQKHVELALHIDDVHARYEGAGSVLAGVSLCLPRGQSVAVMGVSGSGKTTLLNCAAGLMAPESGSILCDGVELTQLRPRELDRLRRETFGFVYQEYNLIEALTALENVQLPTYFTGKVISRDQAMDALRVVGLESYASRKSAQLSGGQRQRVAIARAIAVPRKVLFADEPTGALDRESSHVVVDQLLALTELGTSLMIVTHDPIVAARANRTVFLDGGRVASEISSNDPYEIGRIVTELGSVR